MVHPVHFSSKTDNWSTPEALFQNHCWMNPPYGSGVIGKWMEKAFKSSLLGARVVCLIPTRTDTRWWHDWVTKGEIEFLERRVKFGNAKSGAPFPSAVVTYYKRPNHWIFEEDAGSYEREVWGERAAQFAPWLDGTPLRQVAQN